MPPPEAVVWYNRGTSAIREGAYFQASKALERALEIDNAFALARARRSEAYAEIELTDRAREELLQAMALLPDRSSLSDAESMYLDAVAATLSRNFKTAIDKYSKIVDSVGDAEKPAAYVDLGRAYEKDENLDKAIESYAKATQLDPQSGRRIPPLRHSLWPSPGARQGERRILEGAGHLSGHVEPGRTGRGVLPARIVAGQDQETA